jgi:hypothetical protein
MPILSKTQPRAPFRFNSRPKTGFNLRLACETISAMGGASKMHFGQLFQPGSMVLVTLNDPREKFLGMLLGLDHAGITLRGIDLQSLDDFAQLMKSGEAAGPSVVFFPMHRIERVELDARNGEIPSLVEQFTVKAGRAAQSFFQEPEP